MPAFKLGLRTNMTNPELRQWADALEQLPVAVAVVDKSDSLVLANAAWRALPKLELVSDHVVPLDDGRTLHVRVVALAAKKRLLWAEDTTEQLRQQHLVEQQRGALLAAHEEATLSRKDLAEVAAVSSHDLKTALRGISLLAQWIGEDLGDKVPSETQQHLELLRSRVARTETMIDALARYLRLGETTEDPVDVDTSALLESIIRKLQRPATFTVRAGTAMPVVLTPRAQLRHVLSELIENAISHHDRADGNVSVEAHDRDSHFEFVVIDDGPGLAERTQERVFRLFRSGSTDTARHVGVGLALVKRIVEGRGGTVSLRSSLNRGSTFSFTWPKLRDA